MVAVVCVAIFVVLGLPLFIVLSLVVIDLVVIVINVGTRNLTLMFGQNQVSNS